MSINGTAVSSTAAELNTLDGITAVVGELNALDLGSTAVGTAIASKAVILDANKDYTGIRNLTITGELDGATLDISGDADIDGTLEADAITVGGTALNTVIAGVTVSNATAAATATVATTVTITDNESTDESNAIIFAAGGDVDGGNLGLESDGTLTYNPSDGKVTATGFVGALTGQADTVATIAGLAPNTATTAASQPNITSLGTLTTLTVDNVIINGTTIGHTSDTDLLTLSDGKLVLAGDLEVQGTTTTVSSTEVSIADRILTLNASSAGGDGGLYVNDADATETGSLLWDVSEDRWIGGIKDSEVNLVTISSTDTLTNKTLTTPTISSFANANHDHSNSAGGGNIALGTATTGNYVGTVTAGSGLTSTGATTGEGIAHSLSVDAAQTGITSLLATDIKIGEDDQTKIDFETADTIHFYAGNQNQLKLVDGGLVPITDNDVDLGTASLEFKNVYVDGTVFADAIGFGTTAITLPSADGSADQVLTTDGSGTLSFVDNTGGTDWQAVKTGNFTASAGHGVFANTSGSAWTLTLPASPSLGDEVSFVDYAGTFDTNNLTIGRNSSKIHGADEDLTVSVERAANTLVFTDSTQGWLLKNK